MATRKTKQTPPKNLIETKPIVGIMGLGYVGLPLCITFAKAGCRVIGYDTDARRAKQIDAGKSPIKHIANKDVASIKANNGMATANPAELAQADAVLICVPTPLTKFRDPDMRYVESAVETAAGFLRKGQCVCLESTTYPGTTRELLLPRLEKTGLKGGKDFHLAYSPEREDPGVSGHTASNIPKVVGGLTPACRERAMRLYEHIVPRTVPVSSLEVAEASKLMENIFRCVNIALVNEMKVIFTKMGIDVWEVIAAASSKPFGYMPFFPGPGLGGHCIPIDPFYLTWKARQFESIAHFIELAGEINIAMPEFVIARTIEELNKSKKSLNGSKLLLMGLAYKRDVDDTRESPSLRLMQLLLRQGAKVDYYDPHVLTFPGDADGDLPPMRSIPQPDAKKLRHYDAIIIATDHSDFDYPLIGKHAKLVVDTRNAMDKAGVEGGNVAKA